MTTTGEQRTKAAAVRPLDARDALVIAALLVAALIPAYREVVRPATAAGAAARLALNHETVNRRAMAEGLVPLWNPYEFGGRPHLADPQTLAFYPPHMLLRLLPLRFFFPASFVLHAWVAALGTYLAARQLRTSRTAAAAASAAVLLASVVVPLDQIAYSLEAYRSAWLPLIVALTLRSAEGPTRLPRPVLVLVVALALTASARAPMYVFATVAAAHGFVMMWPSSATRRPWRVLGQMVVLAGLATGLIAFQLAPVARLWATMRGDRALITAGTGIGPALIAPDSGIGEALRVRNPGGRILSTCDRALDASQLVPLGLAGVGGYGGLLLADYARFTNIVRGPQQQMRPLFTGVPEAPAGPARLDLLSLLGVEYLVACEPPDPQRWTLVQERGGVGLYRGAAPAPRAFWTCAPVPVGRDEMEHRMRRGDYDRRLVLQPDVIIHVRWPAGISDQNKARAESDLHLVPQRDLGDRTWQYNLLDRSPANLAAIVQHPLVEDTQGIDRGTLALTAAAEKTPDFDEPKTEWLIGHDACDAPVPATVRTRDRFDGGMSVDVTAPRDGMVFFSETYYRDRRAWVDGRRIRPMKVNLAFTGVRVPAGTHHVQLRYDTRALRAGAGVSLITLLVWIAAARRSRSAARQ